MTEEETGEGDEGEEDGEGITDPAARLICFSTDGVRKSPRIKESVRKVIFTPTKTPTTLKQGDTNETPTTSPPVPTIIMTNPDEPETETQNDASGSEEELEPFVKVALPPMEELADPNVNPNLTPIYFHPISRGRKPMKEAAEMTLSQFQQACDLLLNASDK
ncbi:MAG: hypothetical protein M1426_02710 [Patescibacteria group bacterium]|nr:hypothetical protein [Patescibacteria group bacterium]